MADQAAGGLLIGRAAEQSGMSMRALRYYDTTSVVMPSARSTGGFRLYSSADVRRLRWIRPLQSLGVNRGELAEALDLLELAHQRSLPAAQDGATHGQDVASKPFSGREEEDLLGGCARPSPCTPGRGRTAGARDPAPVF